MDSRNKSANDDVSRFQIIIVIAALVAAIHVTGDRAAASRM
jgi:hypothetical protein